MRSWRHDVTSARSRYFLYNRCKIRCLPSTLQMYFHFVARLLRIPFAFLSNQWTANSLSSSTNAHPVLSCLGICSHWYDGFYLAPRFGDSWTRENAFDALWNWYSEGTIFVEIVVSLTFMQHMEVFHFFWLIYINPRWSSHLTEIKCTRTGDFLPRIEKLRTVHWSYCLQVFPQT